MLMHRTPLDQREAPEPSANCIEARRTINDDDGPASSDRGYNNHPGAPARLPSLSPPMFSDREQHLLTILPHTKHHEKGNQHRFTCRT